MNGVFVMILRLNVVGSLNRSLKMKLRHYE